MLRTKAGTGRWGLRARLLLPVLGLAVATAVFLGIIGNLSARKQAETLLEQRGLAALENITTQVEEWQHSEELSARLLASNADLAAAIEKGDEVAVAQALVPMKSRLDLGFVNVYAVDERELLRLGESEEHLYAPLTSQALIGLTRSTATVGEKGFQVSAVAPVKGSEGVVGAVAVGTVLDQDDLEKVKGQDDVELAVYQESGLVGTSVEQPDLVRLLREHGTGPWDLEELNRDLEGFDFDATARFLEGSTRILALVPTQDLESASKQRNLLVLASSLLLMGVLLVVVLLLARNISHPLSSIIAATGEMVRGNYERRVPPSKIRELDNLGGAVNHLAQQLKVQLATLNHQAFHDPLTDLPNRALLMERLSRALAGKSQHDNLIGVLFVDLDNFKVINDSLGHQKGDELLVGVSRRLQECVRDTDTVARHGGDEFTFLLEDLADAAEAVRVAERIAAKLEAPFTLSGDHEVFTTASVGIALNTFDYDLPEDLLRNADIALYKAKRGGKANHEVYDSDAHSHVWERLRLETEMRRAIEEGQFRIHYQPKVLLETGELCGVEALVRWQHPERGLVSPAKFIPLAEETGLIVPIGRWILEEACRQAHEWQERYPSAPLLEVGVNLSARQVQSPRLVQDIAQVLQETGLDPRRLSLEITESVLMEDAESTVTTLRELQVLGVGLAIDDFGTGYSSLAYLKRFPVDTLKVDRSFVDGLGEDPEDTAIVAATIDLAHALGLKVIAEGVETAEQRTHLRELGCESAQGYYFSKPIPDRELSEILENRFLLMRR